MSKRILDLCGGTGAWSAPYRDAGYDVTVVTLPLWDVRTWFPRALSFAELHVHGILAAPPCTHFSGSGAQYWSAKDADGRTAADLEVVDACLEIIRFCKPAWWALENPIGRLRKLRPALGEPTLTFDPCDYGDPYTKRTQLFGSFSLPERAPVAAERVCAQGSWLQKLGGSSARTKLLRSQTPPGFARAFFAANP